MNNHLTLKYMSNGQVKHFFYTEKAIIAICGKKPFGSNGSSWREDIQGLRRRPFCKKCEDLLNQ